jgi:hypothetical protein
MSFLSVCRQVYNPPNATPIIVDKITQEEFMQQTLQLREKRQSLQVKHAYRLRNDSKRALKVRTNNHQCPYLLKYVPYVISSGSMAYVLMFSGGTMHHTIHVSKLHLICTP